MKEQPVLKDGAPLLLPSARVECRPGTELHVLHLASTSVLLSEGAAVILGLCNGRHSRTDIQVRLIALGYHQLSQHVGPFLDAARDRSWVVDLKLPAVQSIQEPACAEY